LPTASTASPLPPRLDGRKKAIVPTHVPIVQTPVASVSPPTPPAPKCNDQDSYRLTLAEIREHREQVRMIGIMLGNWRETARTCGLKESRVLNWVVRYGWKLPARYRTAPKNALVWSPVVNAE